MRRKPSVVLWGGRPGIDWQFGGSYDVVQAKFRRDFVRLARTVRSIIAPALQRVAGELGGKR